MFVLLSYAAIGAGILFLLVLMVLAGSTLLWVFIWAFFRFRYHTAGNHQVVRKRAQIFLAVAALGMILFPPLAEVGIWQPAEEYDPFIASIDRRYFGSIPSYQAIWHVGEEEMTPPNEHIRSGTQHLLGRRLQIDAVILLGQLTLLMIGIAPFLRTVEQTDRSKPPASM